MLVSLFSVVLLPSAWLGFYLLCRRLSHPGHIAVDRRFSFLLACGAWGVLVVMITEALSAVSQVNRAGLVTAWLCANGIIWGTCVWGRKSTAFRDMIRSESGQLRVWMNQPATWPWDVRLMLLATVLLGMVSGVIALLTPTMNWDSLTYHLPRVMHWIQQGSVRHYPTACISQLQMGPWAAFVQTHLILLWSSDRLANMVQWTAMTGCATLAPWVAAELAPAPGTRSIRAQVLAALLVVTLPTGLVEAITPQTDYVTAFWFISLLGVFLELMKNPSNMILVSFAGCMVGLGLLTKITTVFWAFPFLLAGGLWFAWQWRAPVKIAGRFFVCGTICLAILLPHGLRNLGLYGSPVGARSTQGSAMNSPLSISGGLSNLIRNMALHANTGIPPLTHGLSRFLAAAHELTGRSLQDPGTTLYADSFQFPLEFKINDSETGNPYHLALILFAAGLLALRPGQHPRLVICAGLLLAGMATFCFLIRWQPWHSRYQLPFFVCFMPVVAATLSYHWPRWALDTAGAVVTAFAVLVIACNETRPVFNPSYLAQSWTGKMLFKYGPVFQEKLATLAGDIVKSGCKEVGLKFNSDDAEYPLWTSLREHRFDGRIENAYVESEAAGLPTEGTNFCVLITMTGRALPAEAGKRFPYRVEYEQTTAYWSERASHWCDLAWFDTESQAAQSVSAYSSVIPFRHRLIPLYFRSPRAGNLHLTGTAVFGQRTLIANNLLRTTIASKVEQSVPLRDGNVAVDFRVPRGENRLSLALVEPLETDSSDARLENFEWSFQVSAQ